MYGRKGIKVLASRKVKVSFQDYLLPYHLLLIQCRSGRYFIVSKNRLNPAYCRRRNHQSATKYSTVVEVADGRNFDLEDFLKRFSDGEEFKRGTIL